MTYAEKLESPQWQRRRLEIYKLHDFTCQRCGNTQMQLTVHHRYYIKGREPWEYPDAALITLCSVCHKEAHEMRDMLLISMCQFPLEVEVLMREALDALADSMDDPNDRLAKLRGWVECVKHRDLLLKAADRKAGRE
jgi:hypothetical protein